MNFLNTLYCIIAHVVTLKLTMPRQVVDLALNGSGIRDTARVLGVCPMTVMSILKKKRLRSIR